MNDLTLVYYTSNRIDDEVAQKIRDHLLDVTENKYPIVSVSQKPLDFGKNIYVGDVGPSKYNCYGQILIGAREAKTKYVACIEDDVLYTSSHFLHRPPDGVFSYNSNYWIAADDCYWRADEEKKRMGMFGCITDTDNLVKNLTTRYTHYPIDPLPRKSKYLAWGEPGLVDQYFGMKNRLEYFNSEEALVAFMHGNSLGDYRNKFDKLKPENLIYDLAPYGNIKTLRDKYWKGGSHGH